MVELNEDTFKHEHGASSAMPRKSPKQARMEESPLKPPPGQVTVVHCMGDDCRAQTGLLFPGKAPFGGAKFLDEGWSVLKEPVEGAAVFVCKTCFEREMMEGEDSGSPMIRGEGQVSW